MPSRRIRRKLTGTPKKPLLLNDSADVELHIASRADVTVLHIVRSASPRVTLSLEKGSRVQYVLLLEGGDSTLRSTVAADAEVRWHVFSLGTASTHSLVSDVKGGKSISQIDWLFRAGKQEKQTIDIRNVFHAKDGGGEMFLRGIAEDKASVDLRGMIDIGLKGGGTETYLTEDVLMLDPTAKVDALPGLEIKTNDVKASHSATVSRVTPEQLFYLQSRGLPEKKARQLYIDGFVGEMIERVPENVRQQVQEMIV